MLGIADDILANHIFSLLALSDVLVARSVVSAFRILITSDIVVAAVYQRFAPLLRIAPILDIRDGSRRDFEFMVHANDTFKTFSTEKCSLYTSPNLNKEYSLTFIFSYGTFVFHSAVASPTFEEFERGPFIFDVEQGRDMGRLTFFETYVRVWNQLPSFIQGVLEDPSFYLQLTLSVILTLCDTSTCIFKGSAIHLSNGVFFTAPFKSQSTIFLFFETWNDFKEGFFQIECFGQKNLWNHFRVASRSFCVHPLS